MADQRTAEDLQEPMKPLEIYKYYLKNTNIAEPYEAEILWALRRGHSLASLLPRIAELIGKLTDDPVFSEECNKNLRADDESAG